MKKLTYIILGLLVCFASCKDDVLQQEEVVGEIGTGEEVHFTTNVTKTMAMSRALNQSVLSGYKTIEDDYKLSITMQSEGIFSKEATYVPVTTNYGTGYDADGTLKPAIGEYPLLWESNTTKYAFEATAGTPFVEPDQSTPELLFAQDRLHGYAFSPFEPENGEPADRIDAPNYHTSKEWYQLNKAWHDAEGQMLASDDYKKIPLFLQHERAWVTVILKAGKGVKREAVSAFYNRQNNSYDNPNVTASIFSYPAGGGDPMAIDLPLKGAAKVKYIEDVNGGASNDSLTMKYDAIVEPHNFLEKPKDDKIAAISISNLNFSFYASNDERFTSTDPAKASAFQEAYNLTAGKHLTIEATLTTDRIVFITAWIEDWTEVVTSTICDDYGQNGDPTVIKSRKELLEFLTDDDMNRAGNVAIIAATELDLDTIIGGEKVIWNNADNLALNATLNIAGATLKSSGRLLRSISSTGNLIQGSVVMNNSTALASAIAETNDGTIDNIDLIVGNKSALVTRAGFVELNRGSILNSSSAMPVRAGDESAITYIGGIAAQSIAPNQSTIPTIDHCTMYAAVKGGENVRGAGIVGLGEGRLTNNTFDYGITLLQNSDNFKNIIHTKDAAGDLNTLTVSDNSWPTIAQNELAGVNGSNSKYHNVLDSQEELDALLTPQHNKIDYKYRIANDFTVMAESWRHASATEDISTQTDHCHGNLYCELDGNGKTITLDTDGTTKVRIPKEYNEDGTGKTFQEYSTVTMLFSNITGYAHDMTLELKKPLIAEPATNTEEGTSYGKYNSTESVAALAYSVRKPESLGTEGVNGNYGVVRNVKVKMASDVYVQGAVAAGLVCWVHHDGLIDNCQVKGSILSWTPNNLGSEPAEARRYVGGVVACAAKGSITNCTYDYYSGKTTLDIAPLSGKLQTFYGGILGGTAVKEIRGVRENPQVSIVDCASWYQATFNVSSDALLAEKRRHGAILGYSYYTDNNTNFVGTITDTSTAGFCQGNWWQADMDGVALNGVLNGYTIETTIGKRNAVTPAQVTF